MVIGITGTIGSGKGMVAKRLEERGFRHVSVSAFLAGRAVARGIPATRIVRRQIGNEFRAEGPTALIEAVLADENPAREDIVVESLHTIAEVEYVQHLGGKVIAVDAPLSLRWERIKSEKGEKDSGSYEEFVAEQDRQMASENPDENNLAAAMAAADFHIANEETPEALAEKTDAVLREII